MTKVEEIEREIESLPEQDFVRLREWFSEKDWGKWDREIKEDSESGRLDFLLNEARESKKNVKLRDL